MQWNHQLTIDMKQYNDDPKNVNKDLDLEPIHTPNSFPPESLSFGIKAHQLEIVCCIPPSAFLFFVLKVFDPKIFDFIQPIRHHRPIQSSH